MHGCEGCRDNLLDYLYDLLDEAEAQQLRAHLDGCPACQRALEQARAQQKLLAAAARVSFPGVAFVPPPAEQIAPAPAAGVRAVLLPVKPRLHRPVRWGRWAAAAAVLLAVAGLGVTGGLAGRDFAAADAVVKEKEEAVADARKAVESANDGLLDAARQRDRRIEEVRHNVRARELRMEVQGPQTIQAGAPAEYVVRTYDLNGNPAAAEIVATLEQPARSDPKHRDKATATYAKKSDNAGKDAKEKQSDDAYKTKDKEKKESEASSVPVVREIQKGLYHVSIPASLDLRPGRSLAMSVAARRKDDDRHLSLQGAVRLTAPVYLTHLTTDKPMYQPGEYVRFRSLTVDRASLRPAAEDFRLVYSLVMPNGAVKVGPRGGNGLVRLDRNQPAQVNGPDGKPLKGVGAGEVFLDESAPGGEWTLMLSEEYGRFPAASRKFTVNRYQKPQLDKKLEFNKPSYGPGDQVKAQVSARRAGGGAVADRDVEIAVTVDDQLVGADGTAAGKSFAGRTDADGGVVAQFTLPKTIERGQATLAVTFHDGAVETIVRPIPVVLKKIDVEFFPEGGDLIAGLSNRVYFQARTPLGKPAQLSATLLEDDRPLPGKIETLSDDAQPGVNQGNGAFTFTPRKNSKYALRIDSPAGVEKTYELPTAREDGVVLHVPAGVFEANQPIRATVTSTRERTLLVGAYCRGRLLDTVRLEKGQTEAVLKAAGGAGGVCRLTVFEEKPGKGDQRDLQPVAERLVYRHPYERLDVDLKADRRGYVPGQKVNLSVFAVNEREKLTPAVVMLAVVDRSVVTMADQKTDRSMPTHLLLTTEVRRADDLEYADFLVGQHAKAPLALDLLLGTQGWRRFAEQSPERFRERLAQQTKNLPAAERQLREEEAERLLVLIGQSTPKTTDFDQDEIDRAAAEFNDRAEVLTDRAAAAAGAVEAASKDESYRSSLAKLAWYYNTAARVRSVAVPVLAVSFVILLLAAVAQLASRQVGKVWLAAVACGLLLALAWAAPLGTPPRGPRGDDWRVAALPLPEKELDQMARDGDDKADRGKDKGEIGGGGQGLGGPLIPPPAAPQPAAGGFLGGAPMPMVVKMANLRATGEGKAGKADDRALFMLDRKGDEMAKAPAKGGKGVAPADAFLKADAPRKPGEKRLHADAEEARQLFFRDFRGAAGKRMKGGEARDLQAILPPLVVREYAHKHPATNDNVRRDFTETVYWHPALVLPDGKADVSFELCDSVTTFEAVAFAHSLDGRLGTYVKRIDSRLPFTLAPKLPIEVTATDRIDVPLTVANNTTDAQKVDLSLTAHDGLKLLTGETGRKLELVSEGRGREVFSFRPSLVEGKASLRFTGKCGPFADGVEHTLRVVPDGFPITGSSSDLLEKSASHKVTLPQTWIGGTLKVRVDVYPSTLADLQKGLDGLLQEPHGCFEQSSTANYPNVLILDYLKTADKLDPQLERKVRELLARGYQKLTSFECQEPGKNSRRGYEWFGGAAPPHEALTAYGLLQFRDMAKNSEVDAAMLKRTKEYLLAQRDGKGGYKRNQRALDTFGRAPDHVTNAYVTWALSEADSDVDLTKELDALQAKAKTTDDPYFLSLVSLSLTNRGKTSESEALLKSVAKRQKEDGGLDGAATSITGSGGQSLRIETTALAVLGWLKVNPVTFGENVRAAVKWIGQQRGGHGAFGSTQSTILALKALIAHAKANKRTPEAGEIRLFVGETKVADLSFPAGVDRPLSLELPDAHKHLVAGDNKLRVEVTGAKNVFPHTLSWTYRTTKPDSSAKAPVSLKTTLAKSELSEGDAVRLTVRVKNATGAGQGMATAIVGLPAGLSLPEDLKQLKEHVRLPKDGKRPLVSAFEVIGRELVLYWRDLAKDQEIVVPVDLVARVPGEYRGPASRAYLYYNAEVKDWVAPLAVTVKAR